MWSRISAPDSKNLYIDCHFVYRDIDKVDELMQDIADQQELAEEISTAISKPVGFGEEFDEVSGFLQITQALQLMPGLFFDLLLKAQGYVVCRLLVLTSQTPGHRAWY